METRMAWRWRKKSAERTHGWNNDAVREKAPNLREVRHNAVTVSLTDKSGDGRMAYERRLDGVLKRFPRMKRGTILVHQNDA